MTPPPAFFGDVQMELIETAQQTKTKVAVVTGCPGTRKTGEWPVSDGMFFCLDRKTKRDAAVNPKKMTSIETT